MGIAKARGAAIHKEHELSYVSIQAGSRRYPCIEDYFVAAPAVVDTKARHGVDKFEQDWAATADLYCGHDDFPLFADLQ